MKKIIPAVFVLILVVIISVGIYNYIKLPDGRTLESREEQLLNITKDTAWNISVEQKIENFAARFYITNLKPINHRLSIILSMQRNIHSMLLIMTITATNMNKYRLEKV